MTIPAFIHDFGLSSAGAGLLATAAAAAQWTAGAALVAETWPPRHRGTGGALMQAGPRSGWPTW